MSFAWRTTLVPLSFVLALLVPSIALAANGQQCAATSTLRGQWCKAPAGGFPNRARCVVAYNQCLAAMPWLMHRWCVQIDQPNCNQNDDCPQDSSCFVHPVNQQNSINLACHLTGPQPQFWSFSIFDVADCKCDCSTGAFPEPEAPQPITAACDAGEVECSACTKPAEGGEGCEDVPVAWGSPPNPAPAEPADPPAKQDDPPAKTPPAKSDTDDAATIKKYWQEHCDAKKGTLFELSDRSYACDMKGLENDVLCEIAEDGGTNCQWAVMVSLTKSSYGKGTEVVRGVIKPDGGIALLPALLNVGPGTLDDCLLSDGDSETVDGTLTCCYKDKAMCVNCIDNKCFCLGEDCPTPNRLRVPMLPTGRVLVPVDR